MALRAMPSRAGKGSGKGFIGYFGERSLNTRYGGIACKILGRDVQALDSELLSNERLENSGAWHWRRGRNMDFSDIS